MGTRGRIAIWFILATGLILASGLYFFHARRNNSRDRDTAPTNGRIQAPPMSDGPIHLRDVTSQTGITFQHTDGSSGRRNIVEAMSAGLALFDYDDDDGYIDIFEDFDVDQLLTITAGTGKAGPAKPL